LRERDWKTLVWALQQQRCVLLLGPEIDSGKGRGPATTQLAERLAADCAEPGPDRSNLALVAYRYAREFGRNDLLREVVEFYRGLVEPLPVHRNLAALPFYFVVTSCHDLLLEAAFAAAGRKPIVTSYGLNPDANRALPPVGTQAHPLIYHLYGVQSAPGSLVLTESDLLELLVNVASSNPPLPQTVTSEIRREHLTFMFLGFGVKHWYLRILLHVLKLSRSERSFAIEAFDPVDVPEFPNLVLFYRDGYRIEVLDADVHTFVQELAERYARTEEVRPAVGVGTSPGMVPARVFICYASENGSAAEQVFLHLQAAELDPWMDRRRLEGGDQWDDQIEEQVNSADYFVVLHSNELARKQFSYVNKEINLGLRRQQFARFGTRFIVPLALDDTERIAEFRELQFEQLQTPEDLQRIASLIKRDYQRRARQEAAE
jgi:hypothetical protein